VPKLISKTFVHKNSKQEPFTIHFQWDQDVIRLKYFILPVIRNEEDCSKFSLLLILVTFYGLNVTSNLGRGT